MSTKECLWLRGILTAAKPQDFLYRELQLALRATVGTQSLDELLEQKSALDQSIAQANLIRRREETAKVMEDNPVVMRLSASIKFRCSVA